MERGIINQMVMPGIPVRAWQKMAQMILNHAPVKLSGVNFGLPGSAGGEIHLKLMGYVTIALIIQENIPHGRGYDGSGKIPGSIPPGYIKLEVVNE